MLPKIPIGNRIRSVSFDKNLECVLFDLDGTLVDTAPDFIYTLNNLLLKYKKTPVDEKTIRSRVSDGARDLVRLGFEIDYEDRHFEDLLEKFLKIYEKKLETTESILYPTIKKVLHTLNNNRKPWGVVTNKPQLYAKILLSRLGLLDKCGVLVCPEHVPRRKPDPEPINLACRSLSCHPSRSIYIGDHKRDIIAAKRAGAVSIAAAYGYIDPKANVEVWGADFIVRKSSMLLKLLESIRFT